ncbi:MAG TPA: hypothetical protein VF434_13455 [Promineifilum sp.]
MNDDDFMDLLSSDGPGPQGQAQEDAPDLLGSLLGGGGAGGLGGLLGSLMGSDAGDPNEGADVGDMAGMLGGLLGGAPDPTPQGNAGAGGGLGALLGGLLGGSGGAPTSFGGGGGPSLPFAGALAEKLGISEQMANMLIMGAIGLLTSSAAKQRSSGRGGQVDFESLSDPDFIRTSGVARRMSEQMDIGEDDAIMGLQQTLGFMSIGATSTISPPTTKKAAKSASTKKSAAKSSKRSTRKKPPKRETDSDFMDLLDDMTS